jgi:hypothetical protein
VATRAGLEREERPRLRSPVEIAARTVAHDARLSSKAGPGAEGGTPEARGAKSPWSPHFSKTKKVGSAEWCRPFLFGEHPVSPLRKSLESKVSIFIRNGRLQEIFALLSASLKLRVAGSP